MPVRAKRRILPTVLPVVPVILLALASSVSAQVGGVTDDDLKDAPPQFKESLSGGRIKPNASELTRQNVTGAPPSKHPRDLNGMYNFLRTPQPKPGAPGGAPPPGGGAARPGATAGNGPSPGPRPSSVGAGACVVPGFAALTSYSTTILVNPEQVVFLMEENHMLRWAKMTDRHDPKATPSFTGDSIAHWDGDTLVIDTTQVKVRGVDEVDHYVEKATKLPDGNVAIDRFKVGPDGRQAPIERITLRWRPDLHYVEDICEDFGEAFGIGYK